MRRVGLLLGMVGVLLSCAPGAHAASPAKCAKGDRPETALQGQLPLADRASGRAGDGYTCNLVEVGFFPSTSFANFDTYKNCAYYSDTIGLYSAEGGTIVLDVSDPRKPKQTDYLTGRATTNAGESLRINRKRGLLVADRYVLNGVARPQEEGSARQLTVYSVKDDCTKPELLADVVMDTATGHEGCFQPDGLIYYMSSTDTITPIDLSDPSHPKQLSQPYARGIHGCSISDDGKRGYFGDIGEGRMLVVDTSEVQARKPDAQMRDLGEHRTPGNTGQQSTIPVTYAGKPYLIDWSEFTVLGQPCTPGAKSDSNFGYPVILDMADETKPREVSRMQTEVMLPENCAAILSDKAFVTDQGIAAGDVFPSVGSQVFLYDSHYCSSDRLHDPTLLACSSFGSGVRVYDIRNPAKPTEIAYYNPGTVKTADGTAFIANATVARPVIRSDLGQIWFPDIAKGFHVVQFREGVWPFKDRDPCPARDYYLRQYDLGYDACRAERGRAVQLPSAKSCRTTRSLVIRTRRLRRVRVFVDGRRVRGVRARRTIRLRKLPRRAFRVRVRAVTRDGKRISRTRRYRTCVPTGRPRLESATTPISFVEFREFAYYCRTVGAHAVAVRRDA